MSDVIFRTAALELQSVDNKEVVKVAGLIRRLKNWYKKRTNQEYSATVDKLNQDTAKMQGSITALYNELNALQSAIKDGEIDEYNTRLNNVKELAAKLWAELKQTSSDSKDYYTLQDMEVPGFDAWFKKFLPKGYDLEFGEIYNKPLKETKWYSNLVPQQISLREGGAFNHLLTTVRQTLVRDSFASPAEANKLLSNKDAFVKAFQEAVVNGVLITANVKKPSKEIDKMMGGSTEIQVTTAPFAIPGSDIQIQAKVDLIDLGTAKSSRSKLSLRRTHYVTALGNPKPTPVAPEQKAASRMEQLQKLALSQEVPYKATPLSELQLADVLRKGYQMAFGSDPTAEALAGGWAQVSLENGRGRQIYNNNFGNVKATDDWVKSGKSYAVKETEEYTKEGKHFMDMAKWKVYPSPEEGAAAYWKLIGNRYKSSMDWMAAGDPTSASVAL
ncbi:MAG TPA: hypothetical protein VM577_09965, partial [Anaerovoracaceae bacterium]|nr:hypothetical protein [Anaerovoracaceae bacterium]